MTLEKLRVKDVVVLKLSHWHHAKHVVVESQQAAHCQLHGDYMHDELTFRVIKGTWKMGGTFSLSVHTEPEILEVVA